MLAFQTQNNPVISAFVESNVRVDTSEHATAIRYNK